MLSVLALTLAVLSSESLMDLQGITLQGYRATGSAEEKTARVLPSLDGAGLRFRLRKGFHKNSNLNGPVIKPGRAGGHHSALRISRVYLFD